MLLAQEKLISLYDQKSIETYLLPVVRKNYKIEALGCSWEKWTGIATTLQVELEIGSGNGHFLVQKALSHPEVQYLGIEISWKRVQKIYEKLSKRGISNVKLICADAKEIFSFVPENVLHAIYVNFPDPWPKLKHANRKLFSQSLLSKIETSIQPGGRFHLVSDVESYVVDVTQKLDSQSKMKSIETPVITDTPVGYPTSSFEEKWRQQGRKIYSICFEKPTLPR